MGGMLDRSWSGCLVARNCHLLIYFHDVERHHGGVAIGRRLQQEVGNVQAAHGARQRLLARCQPRAQVPARQRQLQDPRLLSLRRRLFGASTASSW